MNCASRLPSLGLRFESHAVEQLCSTRRSGANVASAPWRAHHSKHRRAAAIFPSRRNEDHRSRRAAPALEKVYAEERAALQSENGMYMLGPECSFVLLSLVDEPWFTIDTAVDDVHLVPDARPGIVSESHITTKTSSAFNQNRCVASFAATTNTFYLSATKREYLDHREGYPPGSSSPGFSVPAGKRRAHRTANTASGSAAPGDLAASTASHLQGQSHDGGRRCFTTSKPAAQDRAGFRRARFRSGARRSGGSGSHGAGLY